MTAKEILDGCRHSDAHIREADGHADEVAAPCRACAERAVAAAVEQTKVELGRKIVCSYCGEVREVEPEKRVEEVLSHILRCEKRPERILVAQLEAAEAAFKGIALGAHQQDAEVCDHCIAANALADMAAIRARGCR